MRKIILFILFFIFSLPISVFADEDISFSTDVMQTTEDTASPTDILSVEEVIDTNNEIIHTTQDISIPDESSIQEISGSIDHDTVLGPGDYIFSDVFVSEGVTLSISPQAHVSLNGDLVVFGHINFEGDTQDSIEIFSEFGSGVYIGNTGTLDSIHVFIHDIGFIVSNGVMHIKNSKLEFLDDGVLGLSGSETYFDTVNYNNDSDSLVQIFDGAVCVIENSTIISSANSYVFGSYRNSFLGLKNTHITPGFGTGIITTGGNLVLDHSVIENGLDDGIDAFPYIGQSAKVLIDHSTIQNIAHDALFGIDSHVEINNSSLLQNQTAIESYARSEFYITMSQSSVTQNQQGIVFGYQGGDVVFDVSNNWWGDASGPLVNGVGGTGGSITTFRTDNEHNIIFTPWLTNAPGYKVPIVIVPGIMASYLNHGDESDSEVWLNLIKALLPGSDSYLDDLILNNDGTPFPGDNIYASDIIKKINISSFQEDFFSGLIEDLKSQGYEEGKNLFLFPYDWRLGINTIANDSSNSLKTKIDTILTTTNSTQVDIIAHSMGGLVSKYFMKHGGVSKVRTFIDIATPHLGAPKAAKILLFGDDMDIKLGFLGLNLDEIKKVSQNMPSVYTLLPDKNYITSDSPDYTYYLYDMVDFDHDGVRGRLSYTDATSFLYNTGRNQSLLQQAEILHDDVDGFDIRNSGVRSVNIVGCGTPTVGKIFVDQKQTNKDYMYHLAYISGDGTVPLRSAESFSSDDLFYVNDAMHGTLPSNESVKGIINSVLRGNTEDFDFNTYQNVSLNNANCAIPNGQVISVHSPVALNVYNNSGQHTGPVSDGTIEQGIPGVVYDTVGDNKFVFVPEGEQYSIMFNATGVGEARFDIETYINGTVTKTETFSQIDIANTNINGEVIHNNNSSHIILRNNGNTQIVSPDSVHDGGFENQEILHNEPVSKISTHQSQSGRHYVLDVLPIATTTVSEQIKRTPASTFNVLHNSYTTEKSSHVPQTGVQLTGELFNVASVGSSNFLILLFLKIVNIIKYIFGY